MQRHRGLSLGLVMGALLALTGNPAQATSITLSVDLNGVVIYSTTSSSPDQTVSASTIALNADLAAAGSAYQFSSLSANSNYTGAATGFLQTTGQLTMIAGGSTSAVLSVDVTQSGFLAPIGPVGTMVSSASGDYVGVPSGTTTYTSDYQSITSAPLTGTASGGSTSFSGMTPPMAIGAVPSGYSLSNHFLISLTQTVGASEGFAGSVLVTAVPEPASGVMLLTGMPLPLAIVFGLIRRRRARA